MGKEKSKQGMDLFDDDEEEQGTSGMTVNKDYAQRYDNWRQLEEMQKMKDKYGTTNLDEMGEDSDSESEDEPEWTAEDEKDFLKTLSALKGGEQKIYDSGTKFFHEKDEEAAQINGKDSPKKKPKKEKKLLLRDYERAIVERGGDIDEEEDEVPDERAQGSDYFRQQEENKKAFKQAVNGLDEEEEDELLVRKEKTDEEKKREEDEYYEWIAGNKDKTIADNEAKELKSLKKAWNSSKMDEDEKFLRNYILNKEYDTDRDGARIPSYEEVVGTTLDADEEEERKGRIFERKYNFRFEEPDQDFIKQYPRAVSESVRQTTNNKRKEQREQLKDRKTREKEEKKAEIKQLKKMKKAEIEKKLLKLRKMAGDDIKVNLKDLEEDFDPKEYDRRMQELFNDEYYGKPIEEEEEKPVFSDLSEDEFDGDSGSDYDGLAVRGGEDQEEDEDSEGDGEEGEEGPSKGKERKGLKAMEESMRRDKEASRRRRKRNSAFLDAVHKKKPIFDPKEKTFEDYFNEYYALDYEDILGDTRTRFKYRNVPANNFGLSTEEILEAEDRQLNAWASLKKAVAYRTEKEEQYDINVYSKKGQDGEKKRRILTMDFGGKRSKKLKEQEEREKEEEDKKSKEKKEENEPSKEENGEGKKKKRKRNKKKNKEEGKEAKGEEGDEEREGKKEENGGKEEKKGRNRKRKRVDKVDLGMDDERLRAYGINAKKFKAKMVYGKKKEEKSAD